MNRAFVVPLRIAYIPLADSRAHIGADGPTQLVQSALQSVGARIRAKELRPALVVIDLVRPGLEGWETLRVLKRNPETAHLPVALVPSAESVLAVGLGSGITLGALALYPEVRRLTCVEIVPSVVDGARLFAPDMYGGYLIYRFAGERKVFMDGRSDLTWSQYAARIWSVVSSSNSPLLQPRVKYFIACSCCAE